MSSYSDHEPIILINTYHVTSSEKQQELLTTLSRVTDKVISKAPGFHSSKIHASLDGTQVVNYAEWESVDHLQHMMVTEAKHLQEVCRLAITYDPVLYHVVSVKNKRQ